MDIRRNTAWVEVCPVCGGYGSLSSDNDDCRHCGWPYGKDWETVEMDMDTELIIRTIVPAQEEQD